MDHAIDHDQYRIVPGTSPSIRDLSTDDDGGLKKDEVKSLQKQLNKRLEVLQENLYAHEKQRLLVVLQATDTGGKDGTIRAVFDGTNPQGVHVASFKKPTSKELAHDYLWRIHQHTPAKGHITVFNRSHYEDIIAVRVKKLYPKEVWKPRYQHIIDFERMLAEEGTTIVKLFLHISKDEQKDRLQARLDNPAKHWKFNPDDLKDRARWDDFMKVYEDLIERTSTEHAPWYIIPADRKWYRNLVVARIMIDTLKGLDMKFPTSDWIAEDISID